MLHFRNDRGCRCSQFVDVYKVLLHEVHFSLPADKVVVIKEWVAVEFDFQFKAQEIVVRIDCVLKVRKGLFTALHSSCKASLQDC